MVQSDICLAVISWIRHGGSNVAERYSLLDEQLGHLFCLHQLSSNASTALTALRDNHDGGGGTGERVRRALRNKHMCGSSLSALTP